ncbi:MAG: hypothetical protein ABIH23_12250 [bacterium]
MTKNTRRQLNGLRGLPLILGIVGLVLTGAFPSTAQSQNKALEITNFEIQAPTIAVPYYHFTARLNLPRAGTVQVQELQVNSQTTRNYYLLHKDEHLDPNTPFNRRRMVLAGFGVMKSSRPDTTYEQPTLISRLDWQDGASYKLDLSLRLDEKEEIFRAQAQATAPKKGGYWNPAWKNYQSAVVSEPSGQSRVGEPVEVTLLFYPYTIKDAAREIRVVRYDCKQRTHHEVPSQVIDYTKVDTTEAPAYNEHGKQKAATYIPTDSATVVFPADAEAHKSSVYLIFYGNENAQAPNYASDLKISGTKPGVVVENNFYRMKLHDLTGMLDELTLKSKPQYTFVHKKETNGAIQWNPGCYAPPKAWVHLSDWEPGKYDYEYEEVRGPVMFMTRRWGQMPQMPELECSMVYKFYANLPYYFMSSSVHVRYDIFVEALRNSEIVFAREAFSEAAWWDPVRQVAETRHIISYPDLTEWLVPDNTPWLAFFDRDKGCGFAGIQTEYANAGLQGRERTLNPYMYITTGPWIYWTRALAYPYGSRNPQQLIKVPAGSVFLEEWAYLPFELSADKNQMFKPVDETSKMLPQPLHVHLDDPIDPRMEVPEEIYIEPTKTGWEK